MKGILIIALVAGVLFFVNYINPQFEDHKTAISYETKHDSPIWEKLGYKDFFVASFTSDEKNGSMVSFGFCKYVKVVDTEWLNQQNK